MQSKYSKLSCLILILVVLILSPIPIHAQDPELFDRIGILDGTYLDQARLVIYDVSYSFPIYVPVYYFDPDVDNSNPELRTQVGQDTLKRGMRLGYTVSSNRGSQPYPLLKEVWILPEGSFQASENS